MFEKVVRMKLRYPSRRGALSTEDLWDLSLQDLNEIAKTLNAQKKANEEEDFLEEKSDLDKTAELKFNVVLHVLNTKKEEKKAREDAAANRAKKQKYMEILERKKDADLETMSTEELEKAIAEM